MDIGIWLALVAVLLLVFGSGLIIAWVLRDKGALPQIREFDASRIPFQLLLDARFSGRLRSAVNEAAAFWNDAIGEEWFVVSDVVTGGSLVPVGFYAGGAGEPRNAFAYARLKLTPNRAGIERASVWVNNERYDVHEIPMTTLRNAIAHELGHVLGLAHDERPDSIMYGKARPENVTVTKADVIFLREAYRDRA